MVGVIETDNIGGGTGESQEKAFQYNTTDPIKQLILEKLNYRIVQKAFGFDDYMVSTRYADFRSDDTVRKINEVRAEEGKEPYVKGGDVAVFAVGREVLPIDTFDTLVTEHDQTAQLELQTKQAQLDSLKQNTEFAAANQVQAQQQQLTQAQLALKASSTPSSPQDNQQQPAESWLDGLPDLDDTWLNEETGDRAFFW
ncbi:MAG: hypothetical protein PVSMB2_37260 [Ktedonobacteraceae bacterium]